MPLLIRPDQISALLKARCSLVAPRAHMPPLVCACVWGWSQNHVLTTKDKNHNTKVNQTLIAKLTHTDTHTHTHTHTHFRRRGRSCHQPRELSDKRCAGGCTGRIGSTPGVYCSRRLGDRPGGSIRGRKLCRTHGVNEEGSGLASAPSSRRGYSYAHAHPCAPSATGASAPLRSATSEGRTERLQVIYLRLY